MAKRTVASFMLNAALLAGSVFYLLSPTVYAYFSEVGLSYSDVPRWFVTSAPARITARIFDRYNTNAPRAARFNRFLPCYMIDDGAQSGPDCAHEIRAGQGVHGPLSLKLASGRYVAGFGFAGNDRCSGGDAHFEVLTTGRLRRALAEYTVRIEPGDRIELPFRLTLMDAALGAVEFRVSGVSNCVLLNSAHWTQASP